MHAVSPVWPNNSPGFPYIGCMVALYGILVTCVGFDWESYRYDYSH
jgi:hypothetical protein